MCFKLKMKKRAFKEDFTTVTTQNVTLKKAASS